MPDQLDWAEETFKSEVSINAAHASMLLRSIPSFNIIIKRIPRKSRTMIPPLKRSLRIQMLGPTECLDSQTTMTRTMIRSRIRASMTRLNAG